MVNRPLSGLAGLGFTHQRHPDAAGKHYGRQAGEGSPWTFVAQADGTVTAVDRASRAGSVTLRIDTKAGPKEVLLQTGPVISGSAVRDSQAYITFNDFTNQIAYANVSREMNRKAMADTSGALSALKVGDKVKRQTKNPGANANAGG